MSLLAESLELFRRMGDKRSTAWVLNHLGDVALAQDNIQQAHSFVDEGQALFREIGSIPEDARTTGGRS